MVLDPEVRVALAEHAARLKHDLGKYVAFQIRWLPPDAPLAERVAALRTDLLATRRGPHGEEDAPSLWRAMRPPLVGEEDLPGGGRVDLSSDPSFAALDAAMVVVEEVVAALRAGEEGEELVVRGTAAAMDVADAARSLHRRSRES